MRYSRGGGGHTQRAHGPDVRDAAAAGGGGERRLRRRRPAASVRNNIIPLRGPGCGGRGGNSGEWGGGLGH